MTEETLVNGEKSRHATITDKLDRIWLPQIQLNLLHTLTYTSKVTVKTG